MILEHRHSAMGASDPAGLTGLSAPIFFARQERAKKDFRSIPCA
jgi:hypothetical protein